MSAYRSLRFDNSAPHVPYHVNQVCNFSACCFQLYRPNFDQTSVQEITYQPHPEIFNEVHALPFCNKFPR
jgi:hypothetical protein